MKQALHPLIRSFVFAFEGVFYTIKTQRNMRIHCVAAVLVLASAGLLRVPARDLILLLIAITLVFVFEMLNTAIEKTVDLITLERHPSAKIIKDVAAGAVLLAAGLACLIGLYVFLPYLIN